MLKLSPSQKVHRDGGGPYQRKKSGESADNYPEYKHAQRQKPTEAYSNVGGARCRSQRPLDCATAATPARNAFASFC